MPLFPSVSCFVPPFPFTAVISTAGAPFTAVISDGKSHPRSCSFRRLHAAGEDGRAGATPLLAAVAVDARGGAPLEGLHARGGRRRHGGSSARGSRLRSGRARRSSRGSTAPAGPRGCPPPLDAMTAVPVATCGRTRWGRRLRLGRTDALFLWPPWLLSPPSRWPAVAPHGGGSWPRRTLFLSGLAEQLARSGSNHFFFPPAMGTCEVSGSHVKCGRQRG